MWRMRRNAKKAVARDSIEQGELPLLWPDDRGSLKIGAQYRAGLSASLLPRLPLSPRRVVARSRRLLLSQSFSSWLFSKNWTNVGFGAAKVLHFEMWLSVRLEICAFNCEGIDELLENAAAELGLEKWDALRLLLRVTRAGARFKSDGELISFR